MAKDILKGRLFGPEIYTEASMSVVVDSSAVLLSDTEGLYFSPAASNAKITVAGGIIASNVGIYVEGVSSRIDVARSGLISGEFAIVLSGADSRATNNGTLIADEAGVWLSGGRSKLVNTGSIWANAGVVLIGDDTVFVNQKTGDISARNHAVVVEVFTADTTSRTVNRGLMAVEDGAVFLGDSSDDTLINSGKLIGDDVDLGGGNDVFDNRGGRFNGSVIGGPGDDMLITDRANLQLVEDAGEGDDTVKSSVTYTLGAEVETLILSGKKDIDGTGNASANTLTGNRGDNDLFGLAGTDTLDGGKGNDRLAGAEDADTFVFATRYGVDTITDFADGIDKIDLKGFDAVADFTDMIDHHAKDRNGNVEIRSGDDRLIIKGTTVLDLDIGDFIFT
ncbi:calcium-binding protein [Rhizobium sp. LjRoot254]|uniref:calcium-binding protein n=1 Tax=Rhizobium sp. LjRoot254 TaxID=3342297 RepID=UPI003ECCA3C6